MKNENQQKNPYIKQKILMFIFVCLMSTMLFCLVNIDISYGSEKENKEETTQVSSDEIIIAQLEGQADELGEENQKPEETTNQTQEQNTVNNSETSTNTTTGESNYYIKINNTANTVTIYKKDQNGKYTVPVKAMVCSTGSATPKSGTYKMDMKYKWHALFGNVYGQYCTRIVGNILFHSVPYLKNGDPSSLEYWEYDKLGTSASAGCIRLTVEDAKWIYTNCPKGTMVEFYSSSNPGPLGKPTATKISSEESPYKNWDPTDPASNNPWKTKPNKNTSTNTQISTNTQKNEIKQENVNKNNTSENKQNISSNTQIETKPNTNTNNTIKEETNTTNNKNEMKENEIKVNETTTTNKNKENLTNQTKQKNASL